MEETAVTDRVELFIADWGAAWRDVCARMADDPIGALDQWDAAIARIDARHFAPGAGCGSEGAFSRTHPEHDPQTEETVAVLVDGDRATVRTTAPHRFSPGRNTHYLYDLVRTPNGWLIARLEEDEAAATAGVDPSAAPVVQPAAPLPPIDVGAGPDYSSVDAETAQALVRSGALVPLLLLPAEFGGTEDPRNTVYVPDFVLEHKRRIDLEIIRPMMAEGRLRRYRATPEYRGRSVVPTALHIRAFDPGEFVADLPIWGDALTHPQ